MKDLETKLKNAVLTDRAAMLENTLKIVKGDVYKILSDYMSLDPDNLTVTADLRTDGACDITVTATTYTLYEIGKMIKP